MIAMQIQDLQQARAAIAGGGHAYSSSYTHCEVRLRSLPRASPVIISGHNTARPPGCLTAGCPDIRLPLVSLDSPTSQQRSG